MEKIARFHRSLFLVFIIYVVFIAVSAFVNFIIESLRIYRAIVIGLVKC